MLGHALEPFQMSGTGGATSIFPLRAVEADLFLFTGRAQRGRGLQYS